MYLSSSKLFSIQDPDISCERSQFKETKNNYSISELPFPGSVLFSALQWQSFFHLHLSQSKLKLYMFFWTSHIFHICFYIFWKIVTVSGIRVSPIAIRRWFGASWAQAGARAPVAHLKGAGKHPTAVVRARGPRAT